MKLIVDHRKYCIIPSYYKAIVELLEYFVLIKPELSPIRFTRIGDIYRYTIPYDSENTIADVENNIGRCIQCGELYYIPSRNTIEIATRDISNVPFSSVVLGAVPNEISGLFLSRAELIDATEVSIDFEPELFDYTRALFADRHLTLSNLNTEFSRINEINTIAQELLGEVEISQMSFFDGEREYKEEYNSTPYESSLYFYEIVDQLKAGLDVFIKTRGTSELSEFKETLIKDLESFGNGKDMEKEYDFEICERINEESRAIDFHFEPNLIEISCGGSVYDPNMGHDSYTSWMYSLWNNGSEDISETQSDDFYEIYSLFENMGSKFSIYSPEEFCLPEIDEV